MLKQDAHPTKKTLVECARQLVARHGVDAVTVDMVLAESGVSKGSLYHHFKDFDTLIQTVQIRNFSEFVDEGISLLGEAFGRASSPEELRTYLNAVIELGHDPRRASNRIERARIVGSSGTGLEFTKALAREQERLRQRAEELIAEAQSRGWVNATVSARALSSFILGFTFGRVLDDVCHTHVNSDEWNAVVEQFMSRVLLAVES